MDPSRLLRFTTIAECGSITRAATILHVSQPTLSRQLADLERETGLRLLTRVPSGVTPTASGELLLQRGRMIRAQLDAAHRELDELRGLRAGSLRIVAFPTAAATIVIDAMLSLRADHPALTVSVEERDRQTALEAVRAGRADIALTFGAGADAGDDTLDALELFEEPMLAALPHAWAAGLGRCIAIGDLAARPWILGTDTGDLGLIHRTCLLAGFEPRVAARLDNQPAIQAAVAASIGVTLLPALAVQHPPPGLTVRRLKDPSVSRRLHIHVLSGPRQPATHAGPESVAIRRRRLAATGLGTPKQPAPEQTPSLVANVRAENVQRRCPTRSDTPIESSSISSVRTGLPRATQTTAHGRARMPIGLRSFRGGQTIPRRCYPRSGSCWRDQLLPSGSAKVTNEPQG